MEPGNGEAFHQPQNQAMTGGASAIASKFTGDEGEQILSYSKEGIIRIWVDTNAHDNQLAKERYANPFYRVNQKQSGNGYNLFNLGGI